MLGLGNKLTNNIYEISGGGTVYTPVNVKPWDGSKGLRWWYVSNDSDVPDTGEWHSIAESGASRVMTQSDSNNAPTVTYTTPGYATFDGSNDFYRLDAVADEINAAGNRAFTIMLVYKINTVGTNNVIISGGDTLNTQFKFENNTTFRITTETSVQQTFVASSGTPFDNNGIKVLFIQRDSSGNVVLSTHGGGTREGFPLDTGSSANTTSATQIKLRQISGDDNDGVNAFDGRIYEIAVWQSERLTSTEADNIYSTYLYPRYSV